MNDEDKVLKRPDAAIGYKADSGDQTLVIGDSTTRMGHSQKDEQDADACAFAAQRDALAEQLDNMITQYGCDCGHPACKRCRDTRDARAALEAARESAKGGDDE